MAWQLSFSRASDPRERDQDGSRKDFYDLVLKIEHCHIHFILLVRSESLSSADRRKEHRAHLLKGVSKSQIYIEALHTVMKKQEKGKS